MCIENFLSDHKYYDSKHYPMSFRRSGDFSIKEADFIEKAGYVIQRLMKGEMQPENDAQASMLRAIKGEQAPANPVEKAWIKYMDLINHPKYVAFLASTSKDDVDDDTYEPFIDD